MKIILIEMDPMALSGVESRLLSAGHEVIRLKDPGEVETRLAEVEESAAICIAAAPAAATVHQRRFLNVVRSIPVGMHMYRLEDDGRLIFVGANPAADEILGVDNRAFIGKTIEEAFPPLVDSEVPTRYRQAAGRGEPWHSDHVVYEHGEIAGAFLVHAFQTAESEMAATFLDITRRIRNEAELRDLNLRLEDRVRQRTAELEALNTELESFAYSVSHDLRGPLRAIDGFSGSLAQECREELGEDGRWTIDRIRSAVSRMGEIIDGLLAMSRAARAEMSISEVDLSRMALAVLEELEAAEPQRRVLSMVEDDLSVQCDPRLLRIVMQNLLSNAWKFTAGKKDARIEVFGCEPEEKHLEGGLGEVDTICVRDNGAGFDMSYAATLFAPFHRLHREEDYPGTGIGLATVQRIVLRHGGQVWAEAAVDHGASFMLKLPRSTPPS